MDTICTYRDKRDELLIAYLYDDIEPAVRSAFETHLAGCSVCRGELDELGLVRAQLEQWAPPEPARALSGLGIAGKAESDRQKRSGPPSSGEPQMFRRLSWRDIPAWAQVAAALLFLGISAAVANLDITYNSSGLSVRTGWLGSSSASGDPNASAVAGGNTSDAAGQAGLPAQPAPWRADLVALEQQLRSEMRSAAAQPAVRAAAGSTTDAEALLRRVRALIEESEQRQQRELALRIAEVDTNVRAQRIADLRNIDRNLTAIQSNTGVGMRQLYNMTNDLAVRVSQTRAR